MTVFVLMNWNYDDSFVVSIWQTPEGANAEKDRLLEQDKKKICSGRCQNYGSLEVVPFDVK